MDVDKTTWIWTGVQLIYHPWFSRLGGTKVDHSAPCLLGSCSHLCLALRLIDDSVLPENEPPPAPRFERITGPLEQVTTHLNWPEQQTNKQTILYCRSLWLRKLRSQ